MMKLFKIFIFLFIYQNSITRNCILLKHFPYISCEEQACLISVQIYNEQLSNFFQSLIRKNWKIWFIWYITVFIDVVTINCVSLPPFPNIWKFAFLSYKYVSERWFMFWYLATIPLLFFCQILFYLFTFLFSDTRIWIFHWNILFLISLIHFVL